MVSKKVFCFLLMDGNFISLTIDEIYRFQKYLESHSVTLMVDNQKLTCICID